MNKQEWKEDKENKLLDKEWVNNEEKRYNIGGQWQMAMEL